MPPGGEGGRRSGFGQRTRKTSATEGGQVHFRRAAEHPLAYNFAGSGPEQDSIPEVAGGDPVILFDSVDDGQVIAGAGAESNPGLSNAGFAQGGPEFDGPGEQFLDAERIDGAVKAGVFDGGADGVAMASSGNDVDARHAQDAFHLDGAWKLSSEHVAFAGHDGKRGFEVRGPGAGGVEKGGCGKSAGGGYDFCVAGVAVSTDDRRMLAEVDSGGSHGGGKCFGEIPRIETGLFKKEEVQIADASAGCMSEDFAFAEDGGVRRWMMHALQR